MHVTWLWHQGGMSENRPKLSGGGRFTIGATPFLPLEVVGAAEQVVHGGHALHPHRLVYGHARLDEELSGLLGRVLRAAVLAHEDVPVLDELVAPAELADYCPHVLVLRGRR